MSAWKYISQVSKLLIAIIRVGTIFGGNTTFIFTSVLVLIAATVIIYSSSCLKII